jgi:membrane-associated phospholipid phosphatase
MATTALKEITHRERPGGEHDRNNSSFPSGHASVAAAVAQVVSRRHRRLGPPVWALVAWIAASRVFLGHHYPSDVLAGLLLGVLIGTWALRFEGFLGRTAAADAAPPRATPGRWAGR